MISIPFQAAKRGFGVRAFVDNAHERLCHRGRFFVLNYVPAVNDAFGALLHELHRGFDDFGVRCLAAAADENRHVPSDLHHPMVLRDVAARIRFDEKSMVDGDIKTLSVDGEHLIKSRFNSHRVVGVAKPKDGGGVDQATRHFHSERRKSRRDNRQRGIL
jgi:hypothetical protein